jgi:hypothetical protein
VGAISWMNVSPRFKLLMQVLNGWIIMLPRETCTNLVVEDG